MIVFPLLFYTYKCSKRRLIGLGWVYIVLNMFFILANIIFLGCLDDPLSKLNKLPLFLTDPSMYLDGLTMGIIAFNCQHYTIGLVSELIFSSSRNAFKNATKIT